MGKLEGGSIVLSETDITIIDRIRFRAYRVWELFRYDIPRFIWNLWLFRKALHNYRWYSGDQAVLPFMETAITDMANRKEKYGFEVDTTGNPRIAKMRRAAELMRHFMKEDFIELAEKELGEIKYYPIEFIPAGDDMYTIADRGTSEDMMHRRMVYDRATNIEQAMWTELWEIIKGNDIRSMPKDNGSDMRGWWD